MSMHIKNDTLRLKNDTMHFIRFGSGSKTLVMLPGLGDGLTTVKGTALPMTLMYRAYARDYTVYMFSRRNHLPEECMHNGDMACMKMPGISIRPCCASSKRNRPADRPSARLCDFVTDERLSCC